MCGIAGVTQHRRGYRVDDLTDIARRMTGTLAHRGPDDAGLWADPQGRIVLGHRRLAVLDLSDSGRQPMWSRSGRWVLTYNGEIYNFHELRAHLEGLGHRFAGSSDTEVLLAAIDQWGLADALRSTNGMFAFAAFDRHRDVLYLARDRLGEKPLYYGWTDYGFAFASELKALRSHPDVGTEIDRLALAQYLQLKYVPTPRTIHREISKLPPGCLLRVPLDAAGRRAEPVAYWSAADAAHQGVQEQVVQGGDDALDRLDELLRDAVAMRMTADVPLGAFLSGGIDSSLIVSLMQVQSTRPVRTFTIGFDERSFNEADDAAAVARHLGTDHTALEVTPADAFDLIPALPTIYDEPFADSSQIPTFLVSRLARRSVTVALSGDGGDELFAGYNRHTWGADVWRVGRRLPLPARRGLARALLARSPGDWDRTYRRVAGGLPTRFQQRLPGDKLHKLGRAIGFTGAMDLYERLLAHWQRPGELVVGLGPTGFRSGTPPWADLGSFAASAMYLDLVGYLPDDILTKVDRASMAVSLEARVPYLDHRVVEFAWRLPLSLKRHDGRGKWPLRQLLGRYVPPALWDRPKAGFGVPIGEWLRGPLRPWAEELLGARRLAREGYLHPGPIRTAWEEHLAGRRNRQYELWDVLMFQAWLSDLGRPSDRGRAEDLACP